MSVCKVVGGLFVQISKKILFRVKQFSSCTVAEKGKTHLPKIKRIY